MDGPLCNFVEFLFFLIKPILRYSALSLYFQSDIQTRSNYCAIVID